MAQGESWHSKGEHQTDAKRLTPHLQGMDEAHELAVGGRWGPPRMQPQDVIPTSCPVCTADIAAHQSVCGDT